MRLAIATHNGLFLAEYDFEENQLLSQQIGIGYYYGIGVHNGFLSVGRRVDPFSKESPTVFEIWNTDGLCLGTVQPSGEHGIQDVHQITASDRGLYICDAYHNQIVYTPHDFSYTRTLPFHNDAIPNQLINSIDVHGNDLFVVQHNRGEAPSEIIHLRHLEDDTFIICESYRLNVDGVHNILFHKDRFYYCSSSTGSVCFIEPERFNTEVWEEKGIISVRTALIREDQHIKGMAANPEQNLLIVGASDEGNLDDRFKSPAVLVFLELESLEYKTAFQLQDRFNKEAGNINEIRILD